MESCASGCFCRYWHFEGDKNAWLERCSFAPQVNQEEQRAQAGLDSATGILAISGGRAIGWLKLLPIGLSNKYAKLPQAKRVAPMPNEWAIACLYVDPKERSKSLSTGLIEAAIAYARRLRWGSLRATPRVLDSRVADEQLFLGNESMFTRLGFRRVGGEDNYPVLRLTLGAPTLPDR